MRIAIFFSNFPFYYSVYAIDFVNSLARAGYSVDLFLQSAGERVPRFSEPVSIYQLPGELPMDGPIAERGSYLSLIPAENQAVIRQICHRKPYDYCLGFESTGLFLAKLAAESSGCRYALFNLEIYDQSNPGLWGDHWARIKQVECELLSELDLLLIPDRERLTAYCESLGGTVREEQVLFFPISLSPIRGPAYPNFWRETLGLSKDTNVLLYVGQLGRYRYNEEMITAVQKLESKAVFVLKAIGFGHVNTTLLNQLKALDTTGRVSFDFSESHWQKRYQRVSGADVGLVYYRPDVVNDRLTGRSSDKLAAYMQSSIPVVCPNYSTFREVVETYQCGICVDDFSQFAEAIDTILKDPEPYRAGASRAFSEVYNVEVHLKNFINHIEGGC